MPGSIQVDLRKNGGVGARRGDFMCFSGDIVTIDRDSNGRFSVCRLSSTTCLRGFRQVSYEFVTFRDELAPNPCKGESSERSALRHTRLRGEKNVTVAAT
jgi:hypothetical protein